MIEENSGSAMGVSVLMEKGKQKLIVSYFGFAQENKDASTCCGLGTLSISPDSGRKTEKEEERTRWRIKRAKMDEAEAKREIAYHPIISLPPDGTMCVSTQHEVQRKHKYQWPEWVTSPSTTTVIRTW